MFRMKLGASRVWWLSLIALMYLQLQKPPLVAHEFGELEKGKHLNFLNKLEPWPDFSSLTLKRL